MFIKTSFFPTLNLIHLNILWLKETNHQIHPLNRAQLIDDIMNLARTKMVSYNYAMNLLLYLKSEENYIPWEAAFNSLHFLRSRSNQNPKFRSLFKKFILELLEDRYQNLGFAPQNGDEEHLTILARMSASRWMCELRYEDCVNNAQSFFHQWMTNRCTNKLNWFFFSKMKATIC